MKSIIRSPKGTLREVVPLSEVRVPDMWHLAEALIGEEREEEAEQLLECWHLCIDLLAFAQENPDYQA